MAVPSAEALCGEIASTNRIRGRFKAAGAPFYDGKIKKQYILNIQNISNGGNGGPAIH